MKHSESMDLPVYISLSHTDVITSLAKSIVSNLLKCGGGFN